MKIFDGNIGKQPLAYEEPQAIGRPKKPPGLGYHGGRHWDRIVGHVVRWGAGEIDTDGLTILCIIYERLREADNDGDINQLVKLAAQWSSLASKFGLSPVDRARMKTDVAPPDKFDSFMQAKSK